MRIRAAGMTAAAVIAVAAVGGGIALQTAHSAAHRTRAAAASVRALVPEANVEVFEVHGHPTISVFLSPNADKGEFHVITYATVEPDGRIDATWFDTGGRLDQTRLPMERFAAGIHQRITTAQTSPHSAVTSS